MKNLNNLISGKSQVSHKKYLWIITTTGFIFILFSIILFFTIGVKEFALPKAVRIESVKPNKRKSIASLSQKEIILRCRSNPCYLPLFKDYSLYPDSGRYNFTFGELFNSGLAKNHQFRNRYIVGSFDVKNKNESTLGLEEIYPDFYNLFNEIRVNEEFIHLFFQALESQEKEIRLRSFVRKKYPQKSLEIIYFFEKVWKYYSPPLRKKISINYGNLYSAGQQLCLCEAHIDTLIQIAKFATSAKNLGIAYFKKSSGRYGIGYYQHLPIGNSRNYYGAQYTITSKNWDTQRSYDSLDSLHDSKMGGGNKSVTRYKNVVELPNFMLIEPTSEYSNAMRQNGIHESALSGLQNGMLGTANSIGCLRLTDFASKFMRWWTPQNANLFILYREEDYYKKISLNEIKNNNYIPFRDTIESNKFRNWLYHHHIRIAIEQGVAKSGNYLDNNLLQAYEMYSVEFLKSNKQAK